MTGRPIVVIGAGVAGSVAAGTLARHSSADLVLVEAGGSTDALFDSDDRSLSFVDALGRPATARDDLLVRRTAQQDPKPYPAGRGVGGSGEINAMVASWGLSADVRAFGEVMPDWREAIEHLPHDLRTANEGEWGQMDEALVDACVRAGIPRNDALWNDLESPEGIGTVTLFARGERRSTGVDAYLRPAFAAGRLRIVRDAMADEVVVDAGVARGVRLRSGEVIEARAVVMCAGAFSTVEVLQRSGVLPDVVRGVQDHPAIALVTRDALDHRATLSIGAIGRLSARGGAGNVHLVPMNATTSGARSHGAILVALMDVESRGSITRHESGSSEFDLDMLSTTSEAMTLVEALRRLVPIIRDVEGRLATTFHLAERSESVDWLESATDAEIASWLRSSCGVYAHSASSVPLGGEFLDRRGAMRAVDGLFVADASAMPRLVAGNPTLAVAALAEVVARNVAATIAAS